MITLSIYCSLLILKNSVWLMLIYLKILQLLEATASAVQPVLEWGESGLAIADGLANLLKVNIHFGFN